MLQALKKNSSFLGHERDWENVSYRCHNLKCDFTNWMPRIVFGLVTRAISFSVGKVSRCYSIIS